MKKERVIYILSYFRRIDEEIKFNETEIGDREDRGTGSYILFYDCRPKFGRLATRKGRISQRDGNGGAERAGRRARNAGISAKRK